jgi:hypothetical protein
MSRLAVCAGIALSFTVYGCGVQQQIVRSAPVKRKFSFTVPAVAQLRDLSRVSPDLKRARYRKVIVVAPSGSSRGAFDETLNAIEGAFLDAGLKVISSAVTARVGKESDGTSNTAKGEGTGLSDVEKALILAKSSGADVMLQVGSWEWLPATTSEKRTVQVSQGFQIYNRTISEPVVQTNNIQRYFKASAETQPFELSETSKSDYESSAALKISVASDLLHFTGRLIEIKTGEVMGTLSMYSSPLGALPDPTKIEGTIEDGDANVRATNHAESEWDSLVVSRSEVVTWPASNDWLRSAKAQTNARVFDRIAALIRGNK